MNQPARTTVDPREQEFANLLTGLMDRVADGEELDLDQTLAEHPEYADELQDLWGTITVTSVAGSRSSSAEQSEPDRPAQNLALPYELGSYRLLEEIGRGGMGIVYRAQRKSDGQFVAVKMILAGNFASEGERERFQAEANAAAQLDHPHIAPIYEIGQHCGMPFYCMKLIEGQTLTQRLSPGPMPARQAASVAAKICLAIQYAHGQGVLHRDIKPSNVLIDEDGEPYIVDFGLAKQESSAGQLTHSGAVLGTPSYMSPEQAAGSGSATPVSFASDVYSLGAVLYHMITGHPPFLGETPVDTVLMVIEQDPINPRALNPRVPRDLEGIVLRSMQKPVDLRYESAGMMAVDLDAFQQQRPVSAREGRFGQVIGNLLRETHHAGVLENWGVLWMWHSLVLLLASLITHLSFVAGTTSGWFYVSVWTGKFTLWAVVFWWLRRRMGPVTFVERQIAHVWAASMCLVASIYPIELALGLDPLDLAPLLAVACGMTFLIKAGILSGSFYFYAIALFVCAALMALVPQYAMLLFGVTSAACFFLPGLKYYLRRRRGLKTKY